MGRQVVGLQGLGKLGQGDDGVRFKSRVARLSWVDAAPNDGNTVPDYVLANNHRFCPIRFQGQ